MDTEYRREMHRNYLILSGKDLPGRNSYPMRMLEENAVPGFLPCSVREIDGQVYLYYDITSKVSLRVILDAGQLDRELLKLLFVSFAGALENMTEYLFWDDCCLAEPDLIFVDSARNGIYFILYPGDGNSFPDQVRDLAESLLPRLKHEDPEAVSLGYSFYQSCMDGTPDAETFRNLLNTAGGSRTELLTAQEQYQKEMEEEDRERLMDSLFSEPEEEEESLFGRLRKWFSRRRKGKEKAVSGGTGYQKSAGGWELPAGTGAVAEAGASYRAGTETGASCLAAAEAGASSWAGMNTDASSRAGTESGTETGTSNAAFSVNPGMAGFGNTEMTYPGGSGTSERYGRTAEKEEEEPDGATRILAPEDMASFVIKEKARLMPADVKLAPIILTGGNGIVGKSARDADYVIDSPVVSRLHARLMYDGEIYRVMDLNSRNGTFINGEKMRINEIRELKDGDNVLFADTLYEYKVR